VYNFPEVAVWQNICQETIDIAAVQFLKKCDAWDYAVPLVLHWRWCRKSSPKILEHEEQSAREFEGKSGILLILQKKGSFAVWQFPGRFGLVVECVNKIVTYCCFLFSEETENVEKFQKRLVKVTPEHNDECKKLLQLMGIPYIEVFARVFVDNAVRDLLRNKVSKTNSSL